MIFNIPQCAIVIMQHAFDFQHYHMPERLLPKYQKFLNFANKLRTIQVPIPKLLGHFLQTIQTKIQALQAFKQPPLLPRGGILADDMGLGKTITTIALLLGIFANVPKCSEQMGLKDINNDHL